MGLEREGHWQLPSHSPVIPNSASLVPMANPFFPLGKTKALQVTESPFSEAV